MRGPHHWGLFITPDSKVHGARWAPGGPHDPCYLGRCPWSWHDNSWAEWQAGTFYFLAYWLLNNLLRLTTTNISKLCSTCPLWRESTGYRVDNAENVSMSWRYHVPVNRLTHWGPDKMDAISQTTFSSAFSWMKMSEFRLKFHWSLFLRVQLTIFHHWFR